MALSDLNYHSYISIFTAASSATTADEFNVFDQDSYSSYSSTTVSSPDISYNSSTGRIHFDAPGDYFIMFSANCMTNGIATETVLKIKKNGTAIITGAGLQMYNVYDPMQGTLHLVVSIEAGDYIECTHDGDHATTKVNSGAYFTAFRTRGHYSSAFYTTKADTTETADNYDLYDTTNEGGVVSSKVNGVTYTGSNGRFTPSVTRRFLFLSTWFFKVTGGAASGYQHKLAIDGSAIDDATAGAVASRTPACHTYSLLKEVTSAEYASVKRDNTTDQAFDLEVGTCFTLLDVSNNGTDPTAMLCFSLTNDSNALADDSGDIDVFDEDNYGTFAKTDHVTATGITYTKADGKFTVEAGGVYLVILNLISDTVTGGNTPTDVKIVKNGSAYFTNPHHTNSTFDPVSHVICLVMKLDPGDYLNFVVNNHGADIDDGTSVTMIKIDEVGESRDLTFESSPSSQIADDYTINTLDSNVLTSQRIRTTGKVLPFSMGHTGPRYLRGRTTSYSPSMGGKVKK